MKKLLPLLLLGVTAMFFSCESYEDNEGKLNVPEVTFQTAQEVLPFMGEITVKIVLSKPATKDLVIPFYLLGNATENRHFEFVGLPEGITADARHYVKITQGDTEATLTLKHLNVNASPVQSQVNLVRSIDDSYALGNNKQLLVKLDKRENVKVTFKAKEYLTREYSNVTIDFKLRGEVTGNEYRTPEDITINIAVIGTAANTNAPHITNANSRAWYVENGNSFVVEEGNNEGSKTIRIRCVNTTNPNSTAAADEVPVFEREASWPTGYTHRFGVTFNNLPDGFILGDETETETDTTFVYIKRIQNPIEEILMGSDPAHPYKWVNVEFGIDQNYGIRGRTRLQSLYVQTGDPSWNMLPRHQASFDDGFTFEKKFFAGQDRYFVKVNADTTSADLTKRSDFAKFFRSGLILFNKYESLDMYYMPLGNGTPSISCKFPCNKEFSWAKETPNRPTTAQITASQIESGNGAAIFIVPASVYGIDGEPFVDINILNASWNRPTDGTFNNFMHGIWNWVNPENPGTAAAPIYYYRSSSHNRKWDLWFRVYRDTRQ